MKTEFTQTSGRRNTPGNRPLIHAFSVLLILLAFGVTSRSADVIAERTPLGRVGVACGGSLPQFDLQIPDTRIDTAGERAAKLGLSWERDLREDCVGNELQALWVYIRMGLTPVGLLAGGAYGAYTGESARRLTPALTVLTNAMAELQAEEALRRQLLLLIQQKSLQPVTLLTNSFPAESAFRVPTLMDEYAPLPFSFAAQQQEKDCGPSAFEGTDTLLMVRVINHGLSGRDGANSPLSLNMAVRATLIRAQDRTQLFGFCAQYDSPPRKFVAWAMNDAQPFREELQRGLQSVAGQIVSQSGLQLPQSPPVPTGIVQASRK